MNEIKTNKQYKYAKVCRIVSPDTPATVCFLMDGLSEGKTPCAPASVG